MDAAASKLLHPVLGVHLSLKHGPSHSCYNSPNCREVDASGWCHHCQLRGTRPLKQLLLDGGPGAGRFPGPKPGQATGHKPAGSPNVASIRDPVGSKPPC